MDLTKISKGKGKVFTTLDKKTASILQKFSIQDYARNGDTNEWWFLREDKAYYVTHDLKVIDLGLSGMTELPESIIEEKEGDIVKMSVFLNTIQSMDRIRGEMIEELLLLISPDAEYTGKETHDDITYHVYRYNGELIGISINDEAEERIFTP